MDTLRPATGAFWRMRVNCIAVALVVTCGLSLVYGQGADEQFRIAAGHYSRSRWNLAEAEFRAFLTRFPDDPRSSSVRFFLGESLVQQRSYPAARKEFEAVVEQAPGSKYGPRARFRAGEISFLLNDSQSAWKHLKQFADSHPGDDLNGYALPYLGQLALDRGAPEQAREYFERCLDSFGARGPLLTDCRFGLGRAMEELGQYAEARRFYRFVAQDRGNALADDATLQLGILHFRERQFAACETALEKFQREFPASEHLPHAAFWLGKAALERGQWAEAAEQLSAALERYGDHKLAPALTYHAALAERRRGRQQEAVALWKQLIDRWPADPWADEAAFARLELLRETADAPQFLELGEQFRREYPASPWKAHVLQLMGQTLVEQRNFAEALELLQPLCEPPATPETPLAGTGTPPEAAAESAAEAASEGAPETAPAAASETAPETAPETASAAAPAAAPEAVAETPRRAPPVTVARPVLADASAAAAPARDRVAALYYLSLAHLGQENYEQALAAVERARALTSEDAAAQGPLQVARAAALMGLARYEEAIVPLTDFLKQHAEGPDVAQCQGQLVVALVELKRLGDAQQAHQQLVADHPQHALVPAVTLRLADALHAEEDYPSAAQLYASLNAPATGPAPGAPAGAGAAAGALRPRVLSGLAWSQLRQGKRSDALGVFERLVTEFPEHALAAEAAVVRGRLLRQEAPEEARAQFEFVLNHHSEHPLAAEALYQSARMLDTAGQDREAAERYQRLVTQHPGHERADDALYHAAWAWLDQRQLEQAYAAFAGLSAKHPDSEYWADAHYRLAEQALSAGEFELAGERLAAVLAHEKCPPAIRGHALFAQGKLAADQRRWAEVAEPLERLLDETPESPLALPARFWIAEARFHSRQYAPALTEFDQLSEAIRRQAAASPVAWLPLVELRRAQTLAHQNQWEQAFARAEAVVAEFPKFTRLYEAYYLIGRHHARQGKFTAAREAYQQAVSWPAGQGSETAARAQWHIGETYLHQKQYAEAIRAYHRVELGFAFPYWQALALLQAGKCHENLQQWPQAIALYQQITTEFSETSVAKDADARLAAARDREAPSSPAP